MLKHAVCVCCALMGLVACGCAPTSDAGAFDVIVTGEGAATNGIAFPPATTGDPFFQDGWQVDFEQVVIFFDKIVISENPDKSTADQSQTGDVVAELDGPWVVDVAKAGPLDSKEMNGKAWGVGSIPNQNKKGNVGFDSTQKYAFGFDLVTASASAKNINTVDSAVVDAMSARGFSVQMKGTATWKGTSCRTTNATYDFNRLPKKIHFSIGFKAPVTFKNCVNPELQPDGSRGIQGTRGAATTAQMTFHLDHPFWEALEEDAPLRWDLIAARASVAVGQTAPAEATITETDLVGVSFQAGKDAQGIDLPWRYCGAPSASDRTTGTVSYDPKGAPVSAAGGATGLKDLSEYMTYNVSTFGHLNNDGLCFPQRNYSAPR